MSAGYRIAGRPGLSTTQVALIGFAIAMGWLEAVVVVYIRAIIGIAHQASLPAGAQLLTLLHSNPWLLPTEQSREVVTLLMLAAVGVLYGDSTRRRFGAFLIAFGIWDLAYYGSLRLLIGWPDSLSTLDCLFLIPPTPLWNQPVWVPMAISVLLIWGGIRLQARPSRYGR
ncbi:MAG: hypothetical protein ACRENS_01655 [Candidatus Eiseniibacteriota bacterium]